jgi:lipoprotein-anchoring transpeptidase ErfK/SrfK
MRSIALMFLAASMTLAIPSWAQAQADDGAAEVTTRVAAAQSRDGAWVQTLKRTREERPDTGDSLFDGLFGVSEGLSSQYRRQTVRYEGDYAPGTIVIDTANKYLYHVQGDGTATRYGVGVGRQGFLWKGRAYVGDKREWPGWTPPPAMRQREPWLPAHMPGGPENPLGARAMYLYRDGADTLYRIHGTNQPDTIGQALSSGCIRMLNADIEHLYERVQRGTKVVVI